jgi:hypothetical protein
MELENAFDAHFVHQYIAYICMHCWALSIRILLWHSHSVSDRRVKTQSISLSLTERSRVSVGILRQHFCEPVLRGGVRATFLPNDAAAAGPPHADAAAAASAETRARRDGVPGVYEDLRLLVPAVLRRLVRDCTSYAHPHALARRVQTQATSDHFL